MADKNVLKNILYIFINTKISTFLIELDFALTNLTRSTPSPERTNPCEKLEQKQCNIKFVRL